MRESRQQAQQLSKVQEDQIGNLKQMLNQTINVKIKYENIIKKLIENDNSRDMVLTVIEQSQSNNPPHNTMIQLETTGNFQVKNDHHSGLSTPMLRMTNQAAGGSVGGNNRVWSLNNSTIIQQQQQMNVSHSSMKGSMTGINGTTLIDEKRSSLNTSASHMQGKAARIQELFDNAALIAQQK